MSSLVTFLSRFRSIEADEIIDLNAQAASIATRRRRLTAKSFFTQTSDQCQHWRYKVKKRESEIPSSQSETVVADIPVTKSSWDEDSLAAASQRSAGSGNALRTMAPLSLSRAELHEHTVFENNLQEDALQMSLISNSTYPTPEVLRPESSLYRPFSLKSSISGFSLEGSPVSLVQAGVLDPSPAQLAQKPSYRKNTKKVRGATENTKKSTKSNTKQQKPRKVKQELRNKPLPAVPTSVSMVKLPREPPVRTSTHVANLMSKYPASAPVWANSDKSAIDTYFRTHPVVDEKQAAFGLQYELDEILVGAKDDRTEKEQLVAPLNFTPKVLTQVPARDPSRRSGDLPPKSVAPNRDCSARLPPSRRPPTAKLGHEDAKVDGGSQVSLEDLTSNRNIRPLFDEKTRRPITIPSNTFIRTGIVPQLRPAVVSEYSESPDDRALYARSFIVHPPSKPSSIEDGNEVVEGDNEPIPHGDKIFINLNRVENVTLNFHFFRP